MIAKLLTRFMGESIAGRSGISTHIGIEPWPHVDGVGWYGDDLQHGCVTTEGVSSASKGGSVSRSHFRLNADTTVAPLPQWLPTGSVPSPTAVFIHAASQVMHKGIDAPGPDIGIVIEIAFAIEQPTPPDHLPLKPEAGVGR